MLADGLSGRFGGEMGSNEVSQGIIFDICVGSYNLRRYHSSVEEESLVLEWPGTTHLWVDFSLEIDLTRTQMTNMQRIIAMNHCQ